MMRTPLKNSKNVNKPFKSPFGSCTTPNESQNKTCKKNIKQDSTTHTPSSTRFVFHIVYNQNLDFFTKSFFFFNDL